MVTIKNCRNIYFYFWHWIDNFKVIAKDKKHFGKTVQKWSAFLAITHHKTYSQKINHPKLRG